MLHEATCSEHLKRVKHKPKLVTFKYLKLYIFVTKVQTKTNFTLSDVSWGRNLKNKTIQTVLQGIAIYLLSSIISPDK